MKRTGVGLMRYLWLPFLLAGCAIQTPVIDTLDRQLESLMGGAVSSVSDKLGAPAIEVKEGELTRYGWRQADVVKPCEIELWADQAGAIRKARWSGYDRSCKPLSERLSP